MVHQGFRRFSVALVVFWLAAAPFAHAQPPVGHTSTLEIPPGAKVTITGMTVRLANSDGTGKSESQCSCGYPGKGTCQLTQTAHDMSCIVGKGTCTSDCSWTTTTTTNPVSPTVVRGSTGAAQAHP